MKKIAVFVEGQTEAIFISEMIKQLFNENKTDIVIRKYQRKHEKIIIDTYTTVNNKLYSFLIFDCGNDEMVKSKIIDNYDQLLKSGFVSIIGLQDLYNPQRKKKGIDDNRYRTNINVGIQQNIPTKIYFAVQETEAWFIAEDTHYQKISPTLTMEIVNSIAGIDVQKDDTEVITHPTVVLDNIYQAGGRKNGYSKNEFVVKDVVSKLDFYNLYLSVRSRNKSFNELLNCFDELIS